MIKVLVGGRTATVFHVFELEIELPKFALYAAVERGAFPDPVSSVTFRCAHLMQTATEALVLTAVQRIL